MIFSPFLSFLDNSTHLIRGWPTMALGPYYYVYVDAENSYFYVNHVGITDDVLSCALESYAAENLSCVIQAIFKLNQENCSSYYLENPNYANQNLISMSSTNVSIAHLPRNQLFCFVAEGKNLMSTVVVTGNFRTRAGCGNN